MTTHFFGDTAVLLGRSLRHITRSLDTVLTVAIMPIALMLMFVYVFGGAIDTGSQHYVDYLLPGILLITVAMAVIALYSTGTSAVLILSVFLALALGFALVLSPGTTAAMSSVPGARVGAGSALLNTAPSRLIHGFSSTKPIRRTPSGESGQSGTGTRGSMTTSGWVMKCKVGIKVH